MKLAPEQYRTLDPRLCVQRSTARPRRPPIAITDTPCMHALGVIIPLFAELFNLISLH